MSDAIALIISLQPDGSQLDLNDEYIAGYIEGQVEEIRQQIGRELLDRTTNYADSEYFVYTDDIREICQLEEDNEKR